MALCVRNPVRALARTQAPRMGVVPVAPVRSTLRQRAVAVKAGAEVPEGGVDGEKILKDLQDKWDKVENKPQVVLYAGAGVLGLWLTSAVIGAINSVPLLPKVFELVGLAYSTWFTYRYLLFKANREELLKDVEELKSKITGQ